MPLLDFVPADPIPHAFLILSMTHSQAHDKHCASIGPVTLGECRWEVGWGTSSWSLPPTLHAHC